MILNPRHPLSILAGAVVLAACETASASSAGIAKPTAAAPTADALLALDRQATQAYIEGDGNFFEGLLSDKFVKQKDGSRLGKSDVIKAIRGVKCEVKKGWTLTRPQMLKIDKDVYVLSYVSDRQGSCTADGKTEKISGPARAATVWVRNGEKWQVAFHGENPIVDPAAAPAADKKNESDKNDKAAAGADAGASPVAATPLTDALMAAENAIWGAWRTHDAGKVDALTASDIAFVDIFGTFTPDKSATVKDWTSALCQIKGVTLTNGVGTSIAPGVGILTLTGTVVGTCGGQDISGQKVYANSVYVKTGGAWKWVFGFNSPT
ncbi:MAG: nuclear transport factor 2 family protein [Proteobacteria bacterium]|nr:nuclear transport factor 2 family protein [Pseudomonadota bacterium]